MELTKAIDIYTADGEKVGSIDRVVLDLETREVTHVVVQKGFLFTEGKVVPISMLGPETEGQITLRAGEFLEDLPQFRETEHVPAGVDRGLATQPSTQPDLVRTVKYNIPEGTVALEAGATLIGSDDKRVGNIEGILTEPQENRASHFVVSKGLLLKERKLVPAEWARTVLQDEVYLSESSDLVDDLPEYKSPPE